MISSASSRLFKYLLGVEVWGGDHILFLAFLAVLGLLQGGGGGGGGGEGGKYSPGGYVSEGWFKEFPHTAHTQCTHIPECQLRSCSHLLSLES